MEQRLFGEHDWRREGVEYLLKRQYPIAGGWIGDNPAERDRCVATGLALLFLRRDAPAKPPPK
jgi:hypothetical protein